MSTNFIATAQYKYHIMNGQTAMLNLAADIYIFGTEMHNVISVFNYAPRSLINHCLYNVIN
jgi:hypothetical protein